MPSRFLDREKVREDLAGMLRVRQGVDVGSPLASAKVSTSLCVIRADHGAVQHPAEDARGVLDGLAAPAELEIVDIEEQGVTAELADADLEADPGPGRRLVEDHPPTAMA